LWVAENNPILDAPPFDAENDSFQSPVCRLGMTNAWQFKHLFALQLLHRHKLAIGVAVFGELELDTDIDAFWFASANIM
jgi:hypothetical protein